MHFCMCAGMCGQPVCEQCLCVYLYIDIDTHFKRLTKHFLKEKTILQSSPAHSLYLSHCRDKVPSSPTSLWQGICFSFLCRN